MASSRLSVFVGDKRATLVGWKGRRAINNGRVVDLVSATCNPLGVGVVVAFGLSGDLDVISTRSRSGYAQTVRTNRVGRRGLMDLLVGDGGLDIASKDGEIVGRVVRHIVGVLGRILLGGLEPSYQHQSP